VAKISNGRLKATESTSRGRESNVGDAPQVSEVLPKCRKCSVLLNVSNWYASCQGSRNYICKACSNKKRIEWGRKKKNA